MFGLNACHVALRVKLWAWIEEAERRYREYKEGHVEGIPAEQVFEDIRQELGWSD